MHLDPVGGRNRGHGLAIVLAGLALIAGSCGDGSNEKLPAVPVVTLPVVTLPPTTGLAQSEAGENRLTGGVLDVGMYETTEFDPPLRISVEDDSWFFLGSDGEVISPGEPPTLAFKWAGDGADDVHFLWVTVIVPDFVLDPSKPYEEFTGEGTNSANAIRDMDDVYALFSTSPHMDVLAENEGLTVWGLPGRSFDAIVVSAPEGSPVYEGSPGAFWHITPMFGLPVGEQVRWTMLDYGDKTIHVIVESSLDDVERFLPIGQRLIDGIELRDS